MQLMDVLTDIHWLDAVTTILGLLYILFEYRASVMMWVVGFVMQLLDMVLYYKTGLYADCGMELYYMAATFFGFYNWMRKSGDSEKEPSLRVNHFKRSLILPWTAITLVLWGAIYWILVSYTDSKVPLADSFTTALSLVGVWALAQKYLEQWFIWIAVDVVTSVLYFYKDIPFKASLYALYVVIAVFGFFKWRKMMMEETNGGGENGGFETMKP